MINSALGSLCVNDFPLSVKCYLLLFRNSSFDDAQNSHVTVSVSQCIVNKAHRCPYQSPNLFKQPTDAPLVNIFAVGH